MRGLSLLLTILSVTSFSDAIDFSGFNYNKFLEQRYPKHDDAIDHERCTEVLNRAVDYSLYRFLHNERYIALPDADLGQVKLTRMLLSGLNTIHRRCDFQLTHQNGTVRAAGCVGVEQVRVSMHASVKLGIFSFTVFPGALVKNLNMRVRAAARMAKGAVAQLEVLEVHSWRPELKFNGKLAIVNWIFNLALKTALKDFILKKVTEEVIIVLKDLLKQNPL